LTPPKGSSDIPLAINHGFSVYPQIPEFKKTVLRQNKGIWSNFHIFRFFEIRKNKNQKISKNQYTRKNEPMLFSNIWLERANENGRMA